MKKTLVNLLILLNATAALIVSIYLFSDGMGFYENFSYPIGFYHHSSGVRISPFFLFMASLLLVIPLVLFLLARKKIWLLQCIVIGILWASWKTDFIQQTLFYYSPTSAYKKINEKVPYIGKYNRDVSFIIKYIEENIAADSLKIEYAEEFRIDSSGITKFRNIRLGEEATRFKTWKLNFPYSIHRKMKNIQIIQLEIINNKIASCTLSLEQNFGFIFYPHGGGSKAKENYKQGYFLETYYHDKDYYYNDYWVINIERSNG